MKPQLTGVDVASRHSEQFTTCRLQAHFGQADATKLSSHTLAPFEHRLFGCDLYAGFRVV